MKLPFFDGFLLMFTFIFSYGSGSETLELRIRQKLHIHNTGETSARTVENRQLLQVIIFL
jgi:hypothetical protein